MLIGFADLIVTAVLHRQGLIVELNPLMRPLIERSEWLFAAVKGGTLVLGWGVMAWYCRHNREFVDLACAVGSAVYVTVWVVWFLAASF
jgi:hypothetical protein